jgi:hypothetical protein
MLALGLLACAACAAVEVPAPPAADFPDAWYGTWEGTAQGWGPDGPRETFTMRYEIGPTAVPGRHQWRIVYRDGERCDVRDHELVESDAARGEFVVDEHGGMELEARLIGEVLYTRFDIGGVRLSVRDELVGRGTDAQAILVEFVTGPSEPLRSTATEPSASSFPARHVQRARLERISAAAASAG